MRKRLIDVAIVVIPVTILLFWLNQSQQILTGTTVPDTSDQIGFIHADGLYGFNIHIWDAATGQSTQLNQRDRTTLPAWSPDGQFLSFIEEPNRLHIFTPGTAAHCLVAEAAQNYAWLDERRIAWLSADGSDPDKTGLFITGWTENGCNDNITRLDDSPRLFTPAVSLDGQRIAYGKWYDDVQDYDITLINTDGTDQRRIERAGAQFHPMWSPDGQEIIFRDSIKDDNGVTIGQKMVRYHLENGETSTLPEVLLYQPAHWSADGKRVLYIGAEDSRVCVWFRATAEARCMAPGTYAYWHPTDDLHIIYAGRDESAICTITLVSEENCLLSWDGRMIPIGWRP